MLGLFGCWKPAKILLKSVPRPIYRGVSWESMLQYEVSFEVMAAEWAEVLDWRKSIARRLEEKVGYLVKRLIRSSGGLNADRLVQAALQHDVKKFQGSDCQ